MTSIKRSISDERELKLEQWIDSDGLVAVLHSIADICGQKADHILHEWQDARTAKVWEKGSSMIEAMANTLEDREQFTRERQTLSK